MATFNPLPPPEQHEDKKRLQRSRVELLSSIYQLQRTGDVDLDIIRAKRVQYNSIVDSIDKLTPKICSDPIDKLPPELFAGIIRKVVAVKVGHDPWYPLDRSLNLVTLFSFTLVSQRWMKFITETPTYWTFIALNDIVADSFAEAWTCLHLSRQLPITVHLVHSVGVERSEVWQELLKHRHRIVRFIDASYPDKHTIDLNKRFRDCMRYLSPLPALESLDYRGGSPNDSSPIQYVLDTFPKLRDLGGFIMTKEHTQSLMSRNCKRINFQGE
ncbi:463_t:CDS:1, partial [Acaulospora colombiana]